MSSGSDRYSRRAFLAQTGLGAAMVPLLSTGVARAATAYPKRLIVVAAEGGHVFDQFWPKGDGENLADLTLPYITEPLLPFRDQLNFIGPLGNCTSRGGHEFRNNMLVGKKYVRDLDYDSPPSGPSIDQYIAGEIAKTTPLPIRSLLTSAHFTRLSRDFETTISAAGPEQYVPTQNDPQKVFDSIFKGRTTSSMVDPGVARARAVKRRILDHAYGDLEKFAKNLGREDGDKIRAHMEAVHQLEAQNEAIVGAVNSCSPPQLPSVTLKQADFVDASIAVEVNKQLPALTQSLLKLTVTALACDATRVAVFTFGRNGGMGLISPSWPGLGPELTPNGETYREHHQDLTHANFTSKPTLLVQRWHMVQLAWLLDQLKNTPEPGGVAGDTMLDNCAVLYMNCMNSGAGHQSYPLPTILAGKAAGQFKTGRFLKYGYWKTQFKEYGSTYLDHATLLLTLVNAFVPKPLTTWGDLALGPYKGTSRPRTPGAQEPDQNYLGELPGLRAGA